VQNGLRIELRAAFAGTNLINSWQDCAWIKDAFRPPPRTLSTSLR